MTNTIDSSLLLRNYQDSKSKTGSDILGKDDFLKILMTQLQNQDPMNPMQDKDFVAQMATFSTLEQITNMGTSINRFVEAQEQNQLVAFSQFVGKEVTWHKVIESEDPNADPVIQEGSGRVASLQFKDNKANFILEDGTILEPGNISQINEVSKESSLLQASMLIGKTVSYVNDKKEELAAIVKSVSFKDGKILFQLNDEAGTKIVSSQITKIE
ncbi:flagellar hook assembly protein FlgD [Bacillus canaveralius]|uniref:Basal-body rod modification protein FlgD n=1 Tax=Bacillus canaveralius TaxID=1403243 RepID=A0A2N5GNY8_9BACI|nr:MULTISPECIES: flagellar hook assembly protein FlgD [Bacillus]PLR84216.1 flagellar hook assembly protein FlgD [Bacillus canaveralius]PLR87465.1 flagellar hook assembly protein FlgD [Bacillus sp. V33-4]PLR96138.1 flagellar hook assembly protein FlgD [Bacillus canaveralius]RSK45128.1 flagellar hook assembly protein FlgD [Bacillus canaveralius]